MRDPQNWQLHSTDDTPGAHLSVGSYHTLMDGEEVFCPGTPHGVTHWTEKHICNMKRQLIGWPKHDLFQLVSTSEAETLHDKADVLYPCGINWHLNSTPVNVSQCHEISGFMVIQLTKIFLSIRASAYTYLKPWLLSTWDMKQHTPGRSWFELHQYGEDCRNYHKAKISNQVNMHIFNELQC